MILDYVLVLQVVDGHSVICPVQVVGDLKVRVFALVGNVFVLFG